MTLQPSSEPVHYDKGYSVSIPGFIILIENLVISSNGICKFLGLWELVRLTMHLRTAVRAITLTRVAIGQLGSLGKLVKQLCEFFLTSERSFDFLLP